MLTAGGVDAQEDKEQDGEAPQRRAAIAKEWQRDTNNGTQAYNHAYVDEEVEEYNSQHTIGVDATEGAWLPLGYDHEPQDECGKENQHECRSPEALFLANGAEDKVGILLGNVLQLGLRAIEEAFTPQPTRSYRNLGLIDIVACIAQVLGHTQQHLDACALVGLQLVEHHVGREQEAHREDGGRYGNKYLG